MSSSVNTLKRTSFSGEFLSKNRWIWSYVGVVILYFLISMVSSSPFSTFTASISFSSFLILVGLGQMLVITNGPGNIDLSIPYTLAFAASFSLKVTGGTDKGIFLGLIVAILSGMIIGMMNFALIRYGLIPPMIATLASSFVIRTLTIVYFRGMLIKPPKGLEKFVNTKIVQLPILFVLMVILSIIVHIVLNRTSYGRGIQAIGQNTKAAYLSSIKVNRYKFITYTLSGLFAGVAGFLLASFTGGATLGMGTEYQSNSIAVVVVGGTSIAGGDSNVQGIIGASILLYLITNFLNIIGAGASYRSIVTGVVIVGIILATGRKESR
jgi:ribose transport system permease protein